MEPVQSQSSKRHETKSRAPLITLFVVLGIILAGAAGYIGALMATGFSFSTSEGIASFESVKNDGNTVITESEQDVSSLIAKVSPGVVSIITSGTSTNSRGLSGYEHQAAGTGMIVSKNGYIMTNKHVVDGASRATVVMSDGKTYENVPVLGRDPLNDVAFLKIPDVSNLKPLEMGDSKTVRTGQSVIAIGNALGQYQNTVTTGIISGLGRPVVAVTDEDASEGESLNDLLQTDAAINHGNSGGPLLNTKGQVVGINTAIAQDAQGIGFAIPIGAAKGMIKHLISTGKVQRAIIGVEYVSIDPEVKNTYGLSTNQGDLVTGLSSSNTPAAKAGLRKNDIIKKVNDQVVGPGKSVSTLIGEFEPGDKVELTVSRGSSSRTVHVTLGAY